MDTLHRHTRAAGRAWLAALGACAALAACGGSSGEDSSATVEKTKAAPLLLTAGTGSTPSSTSSTPTVTATATPASTEGRLLASNCFQCHGTNGTGGFDSIRGGEAEEVLEFLTKTASREIMAAHAQGYTRAQLQKVIAYLQQ